MISSQLIYHDIVILRHHQHEELVSRSQLCEEF